MDKENKLELETKIEKASKTGINRLEMAIGLGMVISTKLFPDFIPFPEYDLIMNMGGVALFGYGIVSIDRKFKYLSKTCKELYKKNKGIYQKSRDLEYQKYREKRRNKQR